MSQRVERRKNLSVEEFWDRYAVPGVPVLLEGLADDWPARSLWTFDFFKRNYGGNDVTIYPGPQKTDPRTAKLSAYLEYMETTRDEVPNYLSRWCFSSSFPELGAQYRRPPHFPCWTDRLPLEIRPSWKWLYIGPPRSGSALHRDFMGTAAWNVLFVGQKTWRFYPPGMRYRRTAALACVQRAGDIIFTPSNWWHQVTNDTCTLALTENFVNDTNGHCLCAADKHERRLLKLFADYGIEPLSMMSLPRRCSTEQRSGSTE